MAKPLVPCPGALHNCIQMKDLIPVVMPPVTPVTPVIPGVLIIAVIIALPVIYRWCRIHPGPHGGSIIVIVVRIGYGINRAALQPDQGDDGQGCGKY